MNGSSPLPSIETLKDQARRLRAELEGHGKNVSHSRSLELLARQHGYRDWNTLHAAAGNRSASMPVALGQQVSGTYLGQHFSGKVLRVQSCTPTDRFRITILFDEPVDVVRFEGFSAFRRRVSCHINEDGKTTEKTSDGLPQLRLHL